MKILRLPAYFYPEQMASTHLQNDRMEGFSKAGHTIVVYTPTPTRGIDKATAEAYKSKKYEELYDGHIQIHRFSLFQEGRNPILRAVRYVLGCLIQYFKACKAEDIDVIYASSTPPIQCLMCKSISKRLSKKAKRYIPIVYNLQDIFPDSLVTTELTRKDSLIWKVGRVIEDKTYDCSDKIIVIGETFKENIMAKGVPEEKIEIIPNWIDSDAITYVPREKNTIISEFGVDPDKFLVVYAGNFGVAQGADVVIETAEVMKDNKDVQFVIFGGGSEYDAVVQRVKNKGLNNVIINPLLPQERVPEVYSLGDVALITCKKGVGDSGLPSKTWSIMACNTPIIASFDLDSELDEILTKTSAGICVEPEDKNALAEAIERFRTTDEIKKYTGDRDYVVNNISKSVCVGKYIDTFEKVLNKGE